MVVTRPSRRTEMPHLGGTSTIAQAVDDRERSRRSAPSTTMKISSFVTTLPWRTAHLLAVVGLPVTTFLATTLSSCAISSSFVTTRSGKARNRCAPDLPERLGRRRVLGAALLMPRVRRDHLVDHLRDEVQVALLAASWKRRYWPGWRLLRQCGHPASPAFVGCGLSPMGRRRFGGVTTRLPHGATCVAAVSWRSGTPRHRATDTSRAGEVADVESAAALERLVVDLASARVRQGDGENRQP